MLMGTHLLSTVEVITDEVIQRLQEKWFEESNLKSIDKFHLIMNVNVPITITIGPEETYTKRLFKTASNKIHALAGILPLMSLSKTKRIMHRSAQLNCCLEICNHFHKILRHFDALPNFLFPTSETMRDYYELPHELPNDLRLRKLGNIKKVPKPHGIIPKRPVLLPKRKLS